MNLLIGLTLLLSLSAQAQDSAASNGVRDTCGGPLFSTKEVTRRARIISREIPQMTAEALAHDVHGQVKLAGVLCRTGRVTDVRVIQGLPHGMTEKAVESALRTKFKPAEIKGRPVSQKIGFEFAFNDDGADAIAIDRAAGRLIERVVVMGYRRFERDQIMQWISSRVGEVCNPRQVQRDLEAILATGYFDKRRSRVFAEEGARGGVGIIFEVNELPLISEVKFEGLKRVVSEQVIVDALLKENVDLRKGAVYDPEKIGNALRTFRKSMELSEQRGATVEVRLENIAAGSLVVTFVFSGIR